jgi:hypothetical protein
VKLSPGRTSLSGRPEFLRPLAPIQTSAAAPVQRKCCACGKHDIVHLIEGEPDHTVTIELKYLQAKNEEMAKAQITPYMASRGWRYKFHLGRFAKERDICRACLIAHQEIEKEFRSKRTNELKSNLNSDSYYLAVCGD